MQNYFNYFTEIEEHFQRGRGTILMLSTLDWALIETWKDAGIPLEAVLRGIDATFEKYNARPSKSRKVNGLAYCSQEVLAAAEHMKQASVGTSSAPSAAKGFDPQRLQASCAATRVNWSPPNYLRGLGSRRKQWREKFLRLSATSQQKLKLNRQPPDWKT